MLASFMQSAADWPIALACLISGTVGALIGGATNFLAIRMLFRPRRAWRVLGCRIPMTPGMIPARQNELAEKIADAVSRHLITPDILWQAIAGSEFEHAAKNSIHRYLQQTLAFPIGESVRNFGGDWERVVEVACLHLRGSLLDLAATEEMRQTLEKIGERHAGAITEQLTRKLSFPLFSPLRNVFEKRFEPTIGKAVASTLHRALKSPETIALMVEELRPDLAEKIASARPGDYIPDDAVVRLAEATSQRVMSFLHEDAEEIVGNIEIRSIVAERVRSFPCEKLEEITLECARRQLRAITALGFLIGGLIGILNPLVYLWLINR